MTDVSGPEVREVEALWNKYFMTADMSSREIEALWNEYFPKVFGYFYRRLNCREDVEDLTSIVMTHFFDSLGKKRITSPNAYLWRIAHNQLASFLREESKTPVQVSLEDCDDYQWVDQSIENSRLAIYKQRVDRLMECAKASLTGAEYALVWETFFQEKTSNRIAQEHNLKPATVRKRLSRSLQKLRRRCYDLWHNF